ncbi:unnamed protein product [Pedinophyceae sp. YPF-701]|nr:unnamed protein product [Pedinophyceae sp. YPF-701]
MGKDLSGPKQLAKQMKAKGLQKLRWYCQLCEKQCRDENGFKCHQTSEGHKRMMMLFGQNPDKVIDDYSKQFVEGYLDVIRQRHCNSRVEANKVYQEYIADRHHVHMNSTHWLTLTDFVAHLGREGLCKVEETEKGFFVTLIQEDPFKKLQDEKRIRIARAEERDAELEQRALEEQIRKAHEAAQDDAAAKRAEATDLQRGEDEGPIQFGVAVGRTVRPGLAGAAKAAPAAIAAEDDSGAPGSGAAGRGRKRTALDDIMEAERKKKREMKEAEEAARRDAEAARAAAARAVAAGSWLEVGLVVKILAKSLKEHGLYKKKGEVLSVKGKTGEIEVLDSGDVVRVDYRELETVIPSPGGRVRVLAGPLRGRTGELLDIDTARFQARVRVPGDGGGEHWMEYEHICKTTTK